MWYLMEMVHDPERVKAGGLSPRRNKLQPVDKLSTFAIVSETGMLNAKLHCQMLHNALSGL
jgi:hypothetical protein